MTKSRCPTSAAMIQPLSMRPDLLALAAVSPDYFPGLLESQSGTGPQSHYDILFAHPERKLVATDSQSLQSLMTIIDSVPTVTTADLPFQWGWLVYFSYEAAACWLPKLKPTTNNQILAIATECAGAIVYDHKTQYAFLCGKNQKVIAALKTKINQANHWQPENNSFQFNGVESAKNFESGINRCRQYIRQGDIYQANLSRKWHYSSAEKISSAALFRRLKASNPAPFATLFQTKELAIVSSSPERLFDINNGYVSTRPIAGTHPRGHDLAADKVQIKRLTSDLKERAEHIMLVDLERHDIGQVSHIGSVEVTELMAVESYRHVHHIVSNIRGRLLPQVSVVDVIKSLFPGGTITGCPKIRCMQIIDEIENRPRGAYTGSLGYINHDGCSDFNILIRTLCLIDNKLSLYAGAGIVYDSDAARETAETEHKAAGVIQALQS